jgi:hypothetical protein
MLLAPRGGSTRSGALRAPIHLEPSEKRTELLQAYVEKNALLLHVPFGGIDTNSNQLQLYVDVSNEMRNMMHEAFQKLNAITVNSIETTPLDVGLEGVQIFLVVNPPDWVINSDTGEVQAFIIAYMHQEGEDTHGFLVVHNKLDTGLSAYILVVDKSGAAAQKAANSEPVLDANTYREALLKVFDKFKATHGKEIMPGLLRIDQIDMDKVVLDCAQMKPQLTKCQ